MGLALDAMLDLMGELHGLERRDALALASLVVDLRVTQVVNGVQGVHALLPHGALKMPAKSSREETLDSAPPLGSWSSSSASRASARVL